MCGHRGGTESHGPKFKKKKRNLVAAYTFLTKNWPTSVNQAQQQDQSIIGDAKNKPKVDRTISKVRSTVGVMILAILLPKNSFIILGNSG